MLFYFLLKFILKIKKKCLSYHLSSLFHTNVRVVLETTNPYHKYNVYLNKKISAEYCHFWSPVHNIKSNAIGYFFYSYKMQFLHPYNHILQETLFSFDFVYSW